MSACDICNELAWLREAVSILLTGAGLPAPGATPFNYWNPADKAASVTLTNSDKTAAANYEAVRSITSHATGKYYLEMVAGGNLDDSNIGFANVSCDLTQFLGGDTNGVSIYGFDGTIYENSGGTSYGSAILDTDVIGLAVDIAAGNLYVRQGGTWKNSADPVAGTGGYAFSVSGALFACAYMQSGGKTATLRTADADFTGTPPTGYTAWG